jgi:K+-transporting ATPase A subunit
MICDSTFIYIYLYLYINQSWPISRRMQLVPLADQGSMCLIPWRNTCEKICQAQESEMTWKEKFYAAPQTTPWQAANCFSRWSLREHIRPFNLKTADGQTKDLRRGTADSHTTHANTKTTSSNEPTERFSSTRPLHAKDITRWSTKKKTVTSVDTWTINKHGRMYYARRDATSSVVSESEQISNTISAWRCRNHLGIFE